MSTLQNWDDETLMGFADDALPADRAAEVAAAVAGDPVLAARVERFRAVRARFADLDIPPPDAGALMARAKAAVAARERRRAAPAWGMSLAAGLAGLAIGAGAMLTRAADPGYGADMKAHGVLQAALDGAASGGAVSQGGLRASPLYTVAAADGRSCRAFRTEAKGGASEGVACRGEDGWRVLAVAPAATRPGGFGQAGSPEPAAVTAALDALDPGDPLPAVEEAALIARRWTRE